VVRGRPGDNMAKRFFRFRSLRCTQFHCFCLRSFTRPLLLLGISRHFYFLLIVMSLDKGMSFFGFMIGTVGMMATNALGKVPTFRRTSLNLPISHFLDLCDILILHACILHYLETYDAIWSHWVPHSLTLSPLMPNMPVSLSNYLMCLTCVDFVLRLCLCTLGPWLHVACGSGMAWVMGSIPRAEKWVMEEQARLNLTWERRKVKNDAIYASTLETDTLMPLKDPGRGEQFVSTSPSSLTLFQCSLCPACSMF